MKRKWEEDKRLTPRLVKNPYGDDPAQVRTPYAHRRGHVNPNKLFKFVRAFPGIWKQRLSQEVPAFKAAKVKVHTWETAPALQQSREQMRKWLEDRFLGDCRVFENVSGSARVMAELEAAIPVPGVAKLWRDYTGDQSPKWQAVPTGVQDLYLTDFDPAMWGWVEPTLLNNMWLQWHGTSVYGASSALATNYLARSESSKKGHETAMGRGVYTSQLLDKALQYGIPTVLDSGLMARFVLLVPHV